MSESRDKFRAHAVQPLPNIPVKPYRNTGAKFDDSTTNKAMFKVEPSAYQRLSAPKKAYVPSPVKFESTSEARDKYTAYATEIRTPPIGLWVANDLVEVMVQPGADRPISVSKMFSTTSNGQDEMELKIVEGWSRKASECTLLTVFEIEGIPQSPAGRPQIRVTLSIDAEGSMTVTAVDRDNDVVLAEETVEVTPAYSVSPPNLLRSILGSSLMYPPPQNEYSRSSFFTENCTTMSDLPLPSVCDAMGESSSAEMAWNLASLEVRIPLLASASTGHFPADHSNSPVSDADFQDECSQRSPSKGSVVNSSFMWVVAAAVVASASETSAEDFMAVNIRVLCGRGICATWHKNKNERQGVDGWFRRFSSHLVE